MPSHTPRERAKNRRRAATRARPATRARHVVGAESRSDRLGSRADRMDDDRAPD